MNEIAIGTLKSTIEAAEQKLGQLRIEADGLDTQAATHRQIIAEVEKKVGALKDAVATLDGTAAQTEETAAPASKRKGKAALTEEAAA